MGTVVMPTLGMKKWRHREGQPVPKVTQLISGELDCEPRPSALIQGRLWYKPREWNSRVLPPSVMETREGLFLGPSKAGFTGQVGSEWTFRSRR